MGKRHQGPHLAEVAGGFYLIIIMMIIIIIIILHHGADDYNHVAMQAELQLGLHKGGYCEMETAGWPAN